MTSYPPGNDPWSAAGSGTPGEGGHNPAQPAQGYGNSWDQQQPPQYASQQPQYASQQPPYASQQGQYGGYQPAPPSYGYPPAKQGKPGIAVAGFVLGIVSVVLCWLNVLDLPIGVVGIILSAVGMSKAKSRGGAGKGLALTGLILSVIGTLAATAILIWAVNRATDCADKYGTGTSRYDDCISTSD